MRLRCAGFAAIQGAVYVDTITPLPNVSCQVSRQVCCFCERFTLVGRQHLLCCLLPSVCCGQREQHALYAGLQQETDNLSDSHHVWSSSLTSLAGDCQVPGSKTIFSQCCGKPARKCSHKYALCMVLIPCSMQLLCWCLSQAAVTACVTGIVV